MIAQTTTHWTPSFPNGQETTWPSVRLNSIFNTHHIKAVSTKLATKIVPTLRLTMMTGRQK